MSVEGFYTLKVHNPANGWVGEGVVILETQRLYGGDSAYGWIGSYTASGGTITATAKIVQFASLLPTAVNMFGTSLTNYEVEMSGDIKSMTGFISAKIPNTPRLNIKLVKQADLP